MRGSWVLAVLVGAFAAACGQGTLGDPRVNGPLSPTGVADGDVDRLPGHDGSSPADPGSTEAPGDGVAPAGDAAGGDPVPNTSPTPMLRLHPDNPRFFVSASGEPVQVSGHGSIAPSDKTYAYETGIAELAAGGTHYARMWHLLPWAQQEALWPWARVGGPGAAMGGDKFDFDSWDAEYWRRLKDSIVRARAAGIYVEIMLFDRCGMSPAAPDRWGSNPWASDNNVNALELPTADDDGTPEFYDWANRPRLRFYQERYVEKMLDETVAFDNVLYEIENEHWEAASPDFGDHYGRFVKAYLATHFPASPRLVSYSSITDDLESFFELDSVDVINKHYGGEPESNPAILADYLEAHWGYGRPVNVDEFANGVTDADLVRAMAWTITASGGHFHLEDPEPVSRPFDVVRNIDAFKRVSAWDFVHAAPDRSGLSGLAGACMVQPGVEVVCYLPTGGGFGLVLPAASYAASFWDPRLGGFVSEQTFAHAGGTAALATPDGRDWVVRVKRP